MKALLLLIAIFTFSWSPNDIHFSDHAKFLGNDTISTSLQVKKDGIDKYLKTHKKEIVILAKVSGKKKLVRVVNEKWPDDVEYSYNILRDKTGRIIFIMQSPFSESGDWDIELHHYFDENGKTFAFSREESIFCDVKGGVLRELTLNYYNSNFNTVSATTKFLDVNFKAVKIKKELYDFSDDKYNIYKNVNDCIKAYNFPM